MALYLGIDGGGSRTQAWLGDERGLVIAKSEAGPSNPTKVGMEAAQKAILRAVQAALGRVPAKANHDRLIASNHARGRGDSKFMLAAVCAGIAGAGRTAISRPLLAWMRKALPARHHLLVTDAEIALDAALGTAPGMIVVSGTGSIAYARNHRGETLRAGGWGAAFDDAGGGYDVGRKAIIAALHDFDGRGPHTVLTRAICRALKLSAITQIVLKKLDIKQIAALFPLVLEAAHRGDLVARRLCAQAGADLAELALALARRLDGRGTLPVVCVGGVFHSSSILRRSFTRCVRERLPRARVRLLERQPVEGALEMARRLDSANLRL